MEPLLCISHQPSVTLGVAGAALDDLGVDYTFFQAWESDPWPDLSSVSGLIVLGGEMNVDDHDNYPFLTKVLSTTAEAVERKLPVLGICLGGQVLARALGGEVKPSPVREVGFHPVEPLPAAKEDPVLAPFTELERVFQWHEDAFSLPRGAQLMLAGEEVPNQAFLYGGYAYGTQFHFEIDEAIIERWCDETEGLEEVWGTSRAELREQASHYLPAQKKAARTAVSGFVTLAGAL